MRILVLGGSGMLGHKLWQALSSEFDCWVTLRGRFESYERFGIFQQRRSLTEVDVRSHGILDAAFGRVNPDVVVNAVGIVKQLKEAADPVPSLEVNALLPHQLAKRCRRTGARLIHLSTDCVFSGQKGLYTEDDVADARDLYGRTKLLGEVTGDGCLTLRTSMIGRELETAHGLVEWFLSQQGQVVKGFMQAVFSGLVTAELARVIGCLVRDHPGLSGRYHVAADPITKYDLLCSIRDQFGLTVTIHPDDSLRCDRSLDGSRFRRATGITIPSWPTMIQSLHADSHLYKRWRASHVASR